VTLASEWTDLLARRSAFRAALEPLGRVIDAWSAAAVDAIEPLECSPARAAQQWADGEPLLTVADPPLDREHIEAMLRPALDVVDLVEDVRPFADAWDGGEARPSDLLPRAGRLGTTAVQERAQLSESALAFLALAALRPSLTRYFSRCRTLAHPRDGGSCPFCGVPPAFADLLEDGRRQLACHVCDGRWTAARLTCPLCGGRDSADLVRLIAEGADEGYAIAACRGCGGYVKEIDRRVRWNGGSPVVEDWGSPHLDVIAQRQGFWRPLPTLVQLEWQAGNVESTPSVAGS
jgi:hypothetical protein